MNNNYCCEHCNGSLSRFNIKGYSLSFLENVIEDYFNYPFPDLISNNLKNKKFSRIKRICVTILCEFSGMTDRQIKDLYKIPQVNITDYIDYMRKSDDEDYKKIKSQLTSNKN